MYDIYIYVCVYIYDIYVCIYIYFFFLLSFVSSPQIHFLHLHVIFQKRARDSLLREVGFVFLIFGNV